MPSMRVVDLAELDRINDSFDNEVDRIKALSDVFATLPAQRENLASIDPFSREYLLDVTKWLEEITGRSGYEPSRDELSNYLEDRTDLAHSGFVPSIYAFGDSGFLGEMLQSIGAILKVLSVRRGESVLEYGAGDGQVSLALARMGCRVTAVDVEQRYLTRIDAQARALGVEVFTVLGPFGTAEPGRRYDRILFFESFHHALDHQALARAMRDQLSPGGSIIFAGEPIFSVDSYFRCTLPYPWGPRLDGLSMRAMRTQGWCELGFAREYFIEMLMRSGYVVEFHENMSTERGSAYKAVASGASIDLGGSMIIEALGMPDCWHPGEGPFRFMRKPVAGIPIDGVSRWRSLSITLHNILPLWCDLHVVFNGWQADVSFEPGEFRTIDVPVEPGGGILRLECPVHKPSEISATSKDDRPLGIAASLLRFHD